MSQASQVATWKEGCLDRVTDMEATIWSNVVPSEVSPPWSPQPPRALSELRQLFIGKEKAAAIFFIPLTIVLGFRNIDWDLLRCTAPIDILYLIAVHCCDSRIVPKSVVLDLAKSQIASQ